MIGSHHDATTTSEVDALFVSPVAPRVLGAQLSLIPAGTTVRIAGQLRGTNNFLTVDSIMIAFDKPLGILANETDWLEVVLVVQSSLRFKLLSSVVLGSSLNRDLWIAAIQMTWHPALRKLFIPGAESSVTSSAPSSQHEDTAHLDAVAVHERPVSVYDWCECHFQCKWRCYLDGMLATCTDAAAAAHIRDTMVRNNANEHQGLVDISECHMGLTEELEELIQQGRNSLV